MIQVKSHCYNRLQVERARRLKGNWNKEENSWEFDEIVADKVAKFEALFSMENHLVIEITAKNFVYAWHHPVYFRGYILARAWDRDSGAKLGENSYLVDGQIDSGGSRANWETVVYKDSVFRLKMPRLLFETITDKEKENYDIKIIG